MADTLIAEPAADDISSIGWNRIIAKLTKQNKGLAAVDFDSYADGAVAPSVKAGGIYEINGAYYEVTADTQITGMSVASTVYYIYSDSGVWTASTTAPEWSESKQGWYDPSDANSRCFFKVTTDSGGEYDDRVKVLAGAIFDQSSGVVLDKLKVNGIAAMGATTVSSLSHTNGIARAQILSDAVITENTVYDAIAAMAGGTYSGIAAGSGIVGSSAVVVPSTARGHNCILSSFTKTSGAVAISGYDTADNLTFILTCTNGSSTWAFNRGAFGFR